MYYPLSCGDHPADIVNVVTGRVGSKEVNVDDAATIGQRQTQEFQTSGHKAFMIH